MSSINQFMERASKAYYNGNPIISNEEYDALERINGQLMYGTGDIPHAYRMYSLNKHYDRDGPTPFSTDKSCTVESPKLDGAAISILYLDGKLQHALTRGTDGILGTLISAAKLDALDSIPTEIPIKGQVQITGEVAASKDMDNSRNFANGALSSSRNLDEFIDKSIKGSIRFIAYNVQNSDNYWGFKDSSYIEDMKTVASWGFSTVIDRDWTDLYPTDGIVYRINDNNVFNSKGFTDKFPRGAFAHKEEAESVSTKLMGVDWQVGVSGKVTPVAILSPVLIGDATISRATLNNIAYIEALNLEIGCEVLVVREGGIIPKIIGRN